MIKETLIESMELMKQDEPDADPAKSLSRFFGHQWWNRAIDQCIAKVREYGVCSEIRYIDGLGDYLHELLVKTVKNDYTLYNTDPAYSMDCVASHILDVLSPYLNKRE